MKFYGLVGKNYYGVDARVETLQNACKELDIDSVIVHPTNFDYTLCENARSNDLLYCISDGASHLENCFLPQKPATFYVNIPQFSQADFGIEYLSILDKKGFKCPKTVFYPNPNRNMLKAHIDYLGGFPLVIKTAGSSFGIGTIKIDSWQSLVSTIDFLYSKHIKFILKEFIEAVSGSRLVVLGDKIIAGADFVFTTNDFRNAADIDHVAYSALTVDDNTKQTIVKASQACNLEFSGIDVLKDTHGDYYIIDVNFPCGYQSLIKLCGVNIPLEMVKYLKAKAENKSQHNSSY